MHKEHIAYMSTRSTLQTSVHVHLPLFSKTNKQTNKAGVLRDVDDDDNVAISSSLHISHFTGMAKKDPDQIATNPPEELGKEEQNPSSKQQRKEQQQHQEQCRHSEKKRGLMRREREDGSCCHLLTSSLEKTAKRRAHTSKKPK
jgi:hypothetical protein